MENLYTYKNFIPAKEHVMLADSLLNALIAFSGELTWSDGVNMLYSRAAQLAVRPYDVVVVNSILDDIGLTRITKQDALADLKRLLADTNVAFGRIGTGKDSGRMAVFLSLGDRLMAFSDIYPYPVSSVNSMWMGSIENVKSRIRALSQKSHVEQNVDAGPDVDEQHRDKEPKNYHFFQPNPEAHNIGDCVVRAFCAVTGESWRSVMRQLASSLDSRNLDFNYNNNFLNLLLEKGFGRCYPTPKIDGRLMNGIELCDWLKQKYPTGDCKAFAFVGRSHVAGILPYEADDGKVNYRFHDSWDSTSRSITDLFIKQDEPALPTEEPKERLASIELGTLLRHPQFGIGRVISLAPYRDDDFITAQFDIGTKTMLKSWVFNHCFRA